MWQLAKKVSKHRTSSRNNLLPLKKNPGFAPGFFIAYKIIPTCICSLCGRVWKYSAVIAIKLKYLLLRIKNHLRTAKQRDGFSRFLMANYRIQNLGGFTLMGHFGGAAYYSIPCCAKMIGFKLDGGKSRCSFW